MKTMKYAVLTAVLVAMLSTCNMVQEPEADKPAGEGKVVVSIQVANEYSEAARSVLPQVTLNDIDHFALWGAPLGTGETELIPSFTQAASIVLNLGTWNFTVKGYKGDGVLILQGELKNQPVSSTSNSFEFSVAPLLEGTGSITITITLPSGSGVTTAAVFRDGEAETSLPVSANRVTYSADSVEAGNYFYSFRLNNSAGNTIVAVSQMVQVRAHLKSEKAIGLTMANLNALPDRPGAPVIEAGYRQLTVTWNEVPIAGDYEVYYSDTAAPPPTPAKNLSNTTTTVISDLTNGTVYSVWVKAKNAAGTSDFSPVASGVPQLPFVTIPGTTVSGSGTSGVFVSGRTVTVNFFAIAKHETTYELWYDVRVWAAANGYTFANQGREGADGTIGAAPTTAKNEPVTSVSWRDVMVWCNAYSEKENRQPVYTYQDAVIKSATNTTACDSTVMDKTKSGFRLPTEVEWEFAARGGNPSDTTNWGYTYAGSNTVGDVAWYSGNSGSNTHPVGTKAANSAGLYDMSGNVWEWCWDWYGSVSSSTPGDGATSGSYRMCRGGAWGYGANRAEVSYRDYGTPGYTYDSVGFRVVCPSSS